MAIQAIPTEYSGQRFRSQLEANWAATLDHYSIKWVYEPEAYRLPNVNYLPDFYLPEIQFWAEAKGPLNERLEKTVEFQAELDEESKHDVWGRQLVVILRPDQRGKCVWEAAIEGPHISMALCPRCGRYGFMDFEGPWRCRYGCESYRNKFWEEEGGDRFYSAGDTANYLFADNPLPFFKAPRPFGRA